MKREALLVGGPADGKLVMVEHDQYHYRYVSVPVVKWSADEHVSPIAERTDTVAQYSPRRRGDYLWYLEGEK